MNKLQTFLSLTFLLLASNTWASNTVEIQGRSAPHIQNENVIGHSYVMRTQGNANEYGANCNEVIADISKLTKPYFNRERMVFDYAYICLFGEFFIQFFIEPQQAKDIDLVLEFKDRLNGKKFYGEKFSIKSIRSIDGNTRLTMKFIKSSQGRKKVVRTHEFQSKRFFSYPNFSSYLADKEVDRQHFVYSSVERLANHVSKELNEEEAFELQELLPKHNYITREYPLYFTLEGGAILESLWTDGVVRYF